MEHHTMEAITLLLVLITLMEEYIPLMDSLQESMSCLAMDMAVLREAMEVMEGLEGITIMGVLGEDLEEDIIIIIIIEAMICTYSP